MAAPSRFKITKMKNGRWSLFDRTAPSPLGGGRKGRILGNFASKAEAEARAAGGGRSKNPTAAAKAAPAATQHAPNPTRRKKRRKKSRRRNPPGALTSAEKKMLASVGGTSTGAKKVARKKKAAKKKGKKRSAKQRADPALVAARKLVARNKERAKKKGARKAKRRSKRKSPISAAQAAAIGAGMSAQAAARGRKSRKGRKGRRRSKAGKKVVMRRFRAPAKKSVLEIQLTKPRSRGRRKKNPVGGSRGGLGSTALATHADNPGGGMFGGLFSNPAGPFSKASLASYATAAVAVTIGFVGADFLDRFVATRAPGESNGTEGKFAWQGRNAAAAQMRRPDGVRLAAQAGGAVVGMALAYWTRSGRLLPWAFGGLSVGFGANMGKMLINGYLMPMIFKVEDATKPSLGNRLYPVEQEPVQKALEDGFAKWTTVAALSGQQAAEDAGIASPLGGGGLLTLGKGHSSATTGQVGAAGSLREGESFVLTGQLGKCDGCGGVGGCYSSCTHLNCGPCASNAGRACGYVVEPGEGDIDNLHRLAAESGTDIEVVNRLNGGLTPEAYWMPGNRVILPFSMCRLVAPPEQQGGGDMSDLIPATSTTTVTEMEGGGGSFESGGAPPPNGGGGSFESGGAPPPTNGGGSFETVPAVSEAPREDIPMNDTNMMFGAGVGAPPPVTPPPSKPSVAPEARALAVGGADEQENENY